ncbi:MAG: penicillin-binding transpeptidase domain-containing protein [Victivallaceae bacterium]|nr:penicillin-binding transpeptidase domain-containing protein [Victivallaceae bacterium]
MKFDSSRMRLLIIGAVLLIIFIAMAVKSFNEQIRKGGEHASAVDRQSIRRIRIPAKRGKIFSADLQVLAESTVSYDVNFYFDEMRRPGPPSRTVRHATELYHELAERLGREPEVDDEEIKYHVYNRAGLPMTVMTNLSDREIAAAFELQHRYPGIEVVADSLRFYPQFETACHLIGYARSQDPAKAFDRRDFFYYQPDLVGRSGLEQYCDVFSGRDLRGLRGEPGYEVVKVDNYGFVRELLDRTGETVNGNNVVLTIDARAQKIAENLLRGSVGAMAVIDADTGAVIVMASAPSYNLNLFSPFIGRERYAALTNDPDKPLFNRALNGSYMPGSTIKPLSALAILENGTPADDEVVCDGESVVDGVHIRCTAWKYGGHGRIDLYTALERSCNDYIIEESVKAGLDGLLKVYDSAGIGRPTGFELGGASGRLPGREAMRLREKRNWSRADTGFVAIGQGMVEFSPLQGALIAGALANGGKLMRPFVIRKVIDEAGTLRSETAPEIRGFLAASPEHIAAVKQGMFNVVNAPRGTGKLALNSAITLYGKTGTAEFGRKPRLRNNSLFMCFGTANDRTYAMFIVIENGAGGGRDCAPLAAAFFEQYLQ